jgi:hypothetical protein
VNSLAVQLIFCRLASSTVRRNVVQQDRKDLALILSKASSVVSQSVSCVVVAVVGGSCANNKRTRAGDRVLPSATRLVLQLSVRRYEKVGTTDRRHETTWVLVVLYDTDTVATTLKKVPCNRYVPKQTEQPIRSTTYYTTTNTGRE